MKYRKLRIAWSVWWGVLAVLLVALWVRSYRWNDFYSRLTAGGRVTTCGSQRGRIYLSDKLINDARMSLPAQGWRLNKLESSPLAPTTVFKWRVSGNVTTIQAPCWFLVPSLAAFGILPWFHWRFGLRTLLIGMTVAAIGLGWIVYAIRN